MSATKTDVLYALLALDAYNRSEDARHRGIQTIDRQEISAQIGVVAWINSSDRLQNEANSPLAGSTTSGITVT